MIDYITVLTPTYNRAHLLPNLYHCLLNQSVFSFEWIVVDDGSDDETCTLFEKWTNENSPFKIFYYKQENGGKHRAVNNGVQKASGQYTIIVDSDDELSFDAVESIIQWANMIDGNSEIAAVSGLKADSRTHVALGGIPNQLENGGYIDAKNSQRRKYGLLGDKAEAYRTSLLKQHPFHEFDGENFLTEDSLWNEFSYNGLYVRWFGKIIYYCEYLPDGLTRSGDEKIIKNFQGFTYSTRQRIKCCGVLDRFIAMGYYYSIAQKKNMGLKASAQKLQCLRCSMLMGVLLRKIKNKVYKR